jgi:hypothetical protein
MLHPGTGKISVDQVGSIKIRSFQVRAHQAGPAEVCARHPRLAQIPSGKILSREIRESQIGLHTARIARQPSPVVSVDAIKIGNGR